MISIADMEKVVAGLKAREERYHKTAEAFARHESLCGFAKGIEDATSIAIAIVQCQREVDYLSDWEALTARITEAVKFDNTFDEDETADYLDGFAKGRTEGGNDAIQDLELVVTDTWLSEG